MLPWVYVHTLSLLPRKFEGTIWVDLAGEVCLEEESVLCEGRTSAAGRRQNAANSQAKGQCTEEALQPRQGPEEPQGPPKSKDSTAVLSRADWAAHSSRAGWTEDCWKPHAHMATVQETITCSLIHEHVCQAWQPRYM